MCRHSMHVRHLVRSVALLCVTVVAHRAAAQEQAGLVPYVPGTATYRVTILSHQDMGSGTDHTITDISTRQRITVTLAHRSRDSLAMGVVLDSIAQSSSVPGGRSDAALAGLRIRAMISPVGALYWARESPPAGADSNSNFAERLRRILPHVKAGATRGTSWTDTVPATFSPTAGTTLSRISAITYTVLGDTTIGDSPAWRLGMTASAKVTGSGTQGTLRYEFAGTGSASGAYYVSKAGVFLGQNTSETQNLNVSTPEEPGPPLPIATKATTTIVRIR